MKANSFFIWVRSLSMRRPDRSGAEYTAIADTVRSGLFRFVSSFHCPIMTPSRCERPAMTQSRTVYSTDHGRLCPECRQAVSACKCRTLEKQQVKGDGVVRIGRETKGR